MQPGIYQVIIQGRTEELTTSATWHWKVQKDISTIVKH